MPCCDDPQKTFDADSCLNVCISCGDAVEQALVDPVSESVTGTQLVDDNTKQTSIRSRHGPAQYVLDGELSEHRAKRFRAEMHVFIGSLCAQMSTPGLADRVRLLFDQIMKNETVKSRWGGQAKAVSGACLAVALRENHKPDRLKEIALLLGQKYVYLQRTLVTLLSAMNIKLPQTTPSHHIPNLLSHLFQELKLPPEESTLNAKLYSQLKSLSLQAVADLSCAFLETFAATSKSKLIQSSTSSCAVSAFIICLEGELGRSLFDLKDLYKCFSQLVHITPTTLARPYKVMRAEVLKWMRELNWGNSDQYKKTTSGNTIRADTSERNVCARGLKAALRERDQLWRLEQRAVTGQQRVQFSLEDDGIDSGEESPDEDPRVKTENAPPFEPKNTKADSCILDGALFLLHPFHQLPKGVSIPAEYPLTNWTLFGSDQQTSLDRSPSPKSPLKNSSRANARSTSTKSKVTSMLSSKTFATSNEFHKALNHSAPQFPTDPKPCDYMNYLLSSDEPVSAIRESIRRKATRMSLQTAALGAADADAIPDDDLLTNEEWELLQRTEEEQEQLMKYWKKVSGLLDKMEKNAERAKKRKYDHLTEDEEEGAEDDSKREVDDDEEEDPYGLRGYKILGDYDLDTSDLGGEIGGFGNPLGFGMNMRTINRFFSGEDDSDED
ncbi:hypothetical protein GYMLUDRAFT_62515 [Collybiopsis luxurians FD-317 M1]|uniref:Uncharacterized protein n=1 Tax=Collybiopsis luxurians FD-317 M1 TaxID=944289 RepID=A0A0D0CBZ0_9AGAR|nr:hypothetical protein GYMLUDRAFT_62515 [Collybiopsis luxurians FD-317 M1]